METRQIAVTITSVCLKLKLQYLTAAFPYGNPADISEPLKFLNWNKRL